MSNTSLTKLFYLGLCFGISVIFLISGYAIWQNYNTPKLDQEVENNVILALIVSFLCATIGLALMRYVRSEFAQITSALESIMHGNYQKLQIDSKSLLEFSELKGVVNKMVDDISESRRVIIEQNESERKRFETLLKVASDGTHILDRDGNLIEFSDRFAQMLGYERAEIYGMNINKWDVTAPAQALVESVHSLIDTPQTFETKYKRKDGTTFDVEINAKGIELDGHTYLHASARDITERKKIEEKLSVFNRDFESFLYQTTDFIYFKDSDSRILFCSQTLATITGHKGWREMIGKHDYEIFPADTAKIYEEEERLVLSDGIPLLNKIDPYYDAAGNVGYVQTNKWPLFDANGKAAGIFGISRDITERVKLEDKLKVTNEHLQELVEQETTKRLEQEKILFQQSKMAAMGEMIGAIAHQWRQPLNAVGINIQDAYLAYKLDDLNDEYMGEFKTNNMAIIQKMSKTIDDFRNFFKPVKSKVDFSIEEAVNETLNIMGPQIRNHFIELVFNCNGEHIVHGYQNELEQAILIIISNAQDALLEKKTKEPFINITVDTNAEGRAVLSIMDNAGGIPNDIIDRVFEPYFTTKEQGKGTGIGLYMAKEIVERQIGGKLSVLNVDGGAKFVIII